MAYRTTVKTLRTLVGRLNEISGNPTTAWVAREDGKGCRAVVGCYVLDCAYGGYRLCQIVGENGGERDITPRYGASVQADLIRAYMAGVYSAQSEIRKAA